MPCRFCVTCNGCNVGRVSRAVLVVLGLLACAQPRADTGLATVILLSWDGMRYDYADRGDFPGLARMAREGVRAGRLTPVYPSSTFPGHVSMATGTYPDVHGIVDNHFFDRSRPRNGGVYRMSPEADWLEAEPLWIAAERQGVRTATYFWVGSETDWRGQGTSYRMAPFDGQRPESAKVDRILAWLGLPEAERPRLIMSYWAGADAVGHRFGPHSGRLVEQIASQDAQLQRLLAGIDALGKDPTRGWRHTTVIVVSDHGMAEVTEYVDLRSVLARAGIAARVSGGAVAQVFVEDPAQLVRAGTVLKALEGVQVYSGAMLPGWMRLAHPSRTGDWVVAAQPPYTFARPAGLEGGVMAVMSAMGWGFGGHGYHPDLAEMGGVYFAMGRGVPDGLEISVVHQVDLAATVALLLGIGPPRHSEGRPVPGIGDHLLAVDPDPG